MLKPTFTFFSLPICVIRLYGDGQFHEEYITPCYRFSVCHIILSSILTLMDSVYYLSIFLLMWTVLYIPWPIITQNDFELFLKHAYLTA
jgi:hypothetical protein